MLPVELRAHPAIRPRDRITPDGIRIDTAPLDGEDPFVGFTEWAGPHERAGIGPARILRRSGTLPRDTAAQVYAAIRSLVGAA